jgi:hypothetical protein
MIETVFPTAACLVQATRRATCDQAPGGTNWAFLDGQAATASEAGSTVGVANHEAARKTPT